MSIDWSKAPEGCIGAFARIISKTAFFVFSKRPSDYSSREGYEGEGEDGPYHVFSEYWEWIDKPWDGQGLPPVGTVCEYYADENTWRRCEIVAHKDGKAVVWVNHAHIWTSSGGILRPIRTPEQIAAEEREKAIEEMCFAEETLTVKQAKALYEAGYRRQEEGK
ncbi:hypothetical protein [Pseudomonas aeruginosa]|uniref:hypothetical protein n=1 Tax=Pseudomonas aeruginosa TaxID=287 RepID=UPI001F420BA6|nr:hypothetical protein [Pseudomonas aeruginosa]MCF3988114.1 hypothetical protein [Pseudomonas aeruginosa]MCF4004071.1 hypothetical protein [Pseudomonas aeruginosa]